MDVILLDVIDDYLYVFFNLKWILIFFECISKCLLIRLKVGGGGVFSVYICISVN